LEPAETAPAAADTADEYAVGPGRPPKQHQWKKGQPSPNPKGRPRKQPSVLLDLKQILEDALKKQVALAGDGKRRTLSKAALGIEHLVNQYAKGDRNARRDLMQFAKELGVDLLAGQRNAIEEALAPNYQAVIEAYLARHSGSAAPTPPASRVIAPPALLDDDVVPSPEPEPEAEPNPWAGRTWADMPKQEKYEFLADAKRRLGIQ
jgi:hypothetical protein